MFLCGLLTFFIFDARIYAQVQSDTLDIHFRLDSIRIDMDFADNRQQWTSFEENFRKHYSHLPQNTLRLDIYSGASPEGTPAHNRWLGENRGKAIRRLVRMKLGRGVGSIIVHNEGARWDGFYDLVAASEEPWRDEVLRIIELPASSDEDKNDHREMKLRALRRGTVWPILLEKYLAPLRSGATAILTWQTGRDTIVVRDTIVIMGGQYGPAHPDGGNIGKGNGDEPTPAPAVAERPLRPLSKRPAWILRSNLPLLGVGTPNLQAEWSIDHRDRWSVNLEAVTSWWTFSHNAYANEIMYGSLELRRWLGNRRHHHTLSGFHVGLAVGGGYGDLEWRSKGYQFEAIMGYLNIGWQHRFGKRHQWAFDAGIGLGYLYAPYRYYHGSTIYPETHTERHDDHLMWRETSHLNWIGIPHANISIGYVFTPRKGLYRRARAAERDSIASAAELRRDMEKERIRQQRDSLYLKWYSMPKAERKAARKAEKLKAKQRKK